AKPDTAELQAMLSPKPAPRVRDIRKARTAETAGERPAAARPATAPSGAFAVQLGSFQKAENAEALSGKLAAKGFRAYTMDWTDAAQTQWKVVRVGAYDSRDDAARVAGELKASFGLSPMVVNAR
ncbi:MAG TPA: SPOR domain-containing protein, partial [Azospirillum sp.]